MIPAVIFALGAVVSIESEDEGKFTWRREGELVYEDALRESAGESVQLRLNFGPDELQIYADEQNKSCMQLEPSHVERIVKACYTGVVIEEADLAG